MSYESNLNGHVYVLKTIYVRAPETANSTTVLCLNFESSERLFFIYCSFIVSVADSDLQIRGSGEGGG